MPLLTALAFPLDLAVGRALDALDKFVGHRHVAFSPPAPLLDFLLS